MSGINRPGVVEDAFAVVGLATVACAFVAPVVVAACVLIERWGQRRARAVLS